MLGMLKIYYINTSGISISDMEIFYPYLSNTRKETIQKLKFEKDKVHSFFSELLVRHVLVENYNMNFRNISFRARLTGKPYIENNLSIHYNISHSGDYVICVISNEEVGIDIEKRETIELDIAKNFFHYKEYQAIMENDKENRLSIFYDYWCLKESYLKYSGRGLVVPLNSFQIEINQDDIKLKNNEFDGILPKLQLLEIDKGYSCALCCEVETITEIIEVNLEKIKQAHSNLFTFD